MAKSDILTTEFFVRLGDILTIDKALDALGITSDDEYYCDISAAFEEAFDIGRPAASYKECYVESVDKENAIIDGVVFSGPLIAEKLTDVHRIFPYTATCGKELAEWAESQGDPLLRYYADMLNQSAAGLMAAKVLSEVKERTGINKLASLNPGSLPAWPVTQQKQLFKLLGEGADRIGVSLTESCLMIPVKSVSGMLFASSSEWFNCMRCARVNCPGRRAPYASAGSVAPNTIA